MAFQERVYTGGLSIPQLVNRLAASKVDVLICGGIDGFCYRQLGNRGISVVRDVRGDAETALHFFLRGNFGLVPIADERGGGFVGGTIFGLMNQAGMAPLGNSLAKGTMMMAKEKASCSVESSCGTCAESSSCSPEEREVHERQRLEKRLGGIRHKFMIMSGKGGVGKTTVAVNLGVVLANEGFMISVADTFYVSQRGGSVTSHIKISKETLYSSVTLKGKADLVLGMEPVETLRTLAEFGNPHVITIVNPGPVYPSGGVPYFDLDEVKKAITKLSSRTTFVSATEEALKMGNPIYTNIILLGSLVGADILPITEATIMPILEERFPGEQLDANIKAFNKGMELIANA